MYNIIYNIHKYITYVCVKIHLRLSQLTPIKPMGQTQRRFSSQVPPLRQLHTDSVENTINVKLWLI